MIDNLNVKCNIPFLIPEQYNDSMSYQELLYSILNAVNNCIDMVNKLPDNIQEEVNKQLSAMISDGTLADLINDTIVNELNIKINNLTEETNNNSSDISKLKTDMSSANNNITQNTNKISALQSDMSSANNKIAQNTNNISTLQTNMNSANNNIAQNTTDINNVKSKQNAALTASAGCRIQTQYLSKINNIAICSFIVVTSNQVTANTTFASLPANFRPTSTMYFALPRAGDTICLTGQVGTDGSIKSPHINLEANSYYNALIVYATI